MKIVKTNAKSSLFLNIWHDLVFTISNSVRSGRSRSGLLISAFAAVNYLIRYTQFSKGQSS